ncbi:high mobility group box domain-containing protein, partial [Thamnocephalis sphaerospora]
PKPQAARSTPPRKDSSAPKRASSAYIHFNNDNRSRVMKENPNAKFADVSRILGNEWRAMGEKDKSMYIQKAAEDKKRYERE